MDIQEMEMQDKNPLCHELEERIRKLQQVLISKGMDGALIVQKTDLFYFSGTFQKGWLFVPAQGKPVLMIFKEYRRARQESILKEIVLVSGTKELPKILAEYDYSQLKVLGMELDVLPTNLYFHYQALFKQSSIADISDDIRLIRAVKSEFEIAKIKTAATLSDAVAARVPELLEEGISEVVLSGKLEGYMRGLGHQGVVRMRRWGGELFFGHLMSGEAAAIPSYHASPTGGQGVSTAVGQGAGFRKIGKHEPVLVDYVFAFDGYLSDHTRIFSIGPVAKKLQVAHEAMLAIQERIKGEARPGVVSGDLYDLMVFLAEKEGYKENFMGAGKRRVRFTGHGLGLELDEYPFIAKGQHLRLEKGMIIALEPKTIFPGKGVVGIENTHLVTDDGLVSLGIYPDEITIV
jgi:Xaa-Pro aminopeptidase